MQLPVRLERKTAEFSLVVLISFICVFLLLLRADFFTIDEFADGLKADNVYYLQLAVGGPQNCHEAPYCWRVLQPMLASFMPFDIQANFLIITVLSVWFTGIVLYYFLRTYDIPHIFSLLGLLLFFSLGWATGFLFFFFWLNDGLAFLIIMLTLYFIRVKNYLCVLALITLGAAAKEVVLAVVPLYYTLTIQPRRPRDLFDLKLAGATLLLAIPAVALLYFIRVVIPITNHYDITEWFSTISTARSEGKLALPLVVAPSLQNSLFSAFFFGNLTTFGLVLLFPFFAPRRNAGYFLRYAPYIILINAQLLVASATERLLVYAFPVVVLMSVCGFMALARSYSLSPLHLLPLVGTLFMLTLFGGGWTWMFLSAQAAILAAYLVFALLTSLLRQRRQRITSMALK